MHLMDADQLQIRGNPIPIPFHLLIHNQRIFSSVKWKWTTPLKVHVQVLE